MKIISKLESTIDYPGKFGQILFVSGCNFRCGFCHNPELVIEKEGGFSSEDIIKELKPLIKRGWYEGVCISGGEPLIKKDLPEFIKKLKDIGLLVKIDTNGSNPIMLQKLIDEKLIDYIAMDIKTTPEKYPSVCDIEVNIKNIEESIKIIKRFKEYEFRTTVLPFFKNEDFEKIGKWLFELGQKEKIKKYTLQQFNREKTFDPSYKDLIPLSVDQINEFRDILKKYCDDVRVLA